MTSGHLITGHRPFFIGGMTYWSGIAIGLPSVLKRLNCGIEVPVFMIRNSVL